jgi:hypothetical protein
MGGIMQIGNIATVATPQTPSPAKSFSASVETSSPLDQSHASASSAPVLSFNMPYSTTARGKNYALSMEESAGVYVASVPNPPGASATGSTPQMAESNLDNKLDALA